MESLLVTKRHIFLLSYRISHKFTGFPHKVIYGKCKNFIAKELGKAGAGNVGSGMERAMRIQTELT